MNSPENDGVFPASLPWEEFTHHRVKIEELRLRAGNTQSVLFLARLKNGASPFLDMSALTDLLDTAARSLDGDTRKSLGEDLTAIGTWYLRPVARAVADVDVGATRRHLDFLSQQGQQAFEALHHILSLMPSAIENCIASDDSFASHGTKLEALAVKGFLKDIERLLPHLTELVGAKKSGRPENFVLSHCAQLAAEAIAKAGLSLHPRHRASARRSPTDLRSCRPDGLHRWGVQRRRHWCPRDRQTRAACRSQVR